MSRCPACGSGDTERFHEALEVPTNSCLLLDDASEAQAFPRGRIDLSFCQACGFMANQAFEPELAEYSQRYEETQGYSPRFVDFGREVAKAWVERHDLHGRHVLEVGCGKGEFLVWMIEAGAGSGLGIDPGVHPERLAGSAAGRIEWIADFYDDRYAHLDADAFVCRHTLEHVQPVAEFLTMVRRNLGSRRGTVVLFEVPDTLRVLEEVAFWDVYYEHCSYFSPGSLARLFRRCGFEVLDVRLAYDDQYVLIDARPSTAPVGGSSPLEDDLARLRGGIETFRSGYQRMLDRWRADVAAVAGRGGEVVLWGGGSKAVAFLTALGNEVEVAAAVDINPHKQGRFLAGSGRPVLAPTDLVDLRPELVIAMNPVYLDEIRRDLDALGLRDARLVAL